MANEVPAPDGADLSEVREHAHSLTPDEYMAELEERARRIEELARERRELEDQLDMFIAAGIERGDEINKTQAAKVLGYRERSSLYKRSYRVRRDNR